MVVLRAVLALALAVAAHLVGVALWDEFSRLVDPFLLVTVYVGLSGRAGVAQLVGAAAGVAHGALAGTLFGLHALANTVVGYSTAVAIQRVVVQRRGIEVVLFALGAILQQTIVVVLLLALVDDPELPAVPWMLGKVVTTGAVGALLVLVSRLLRHRWRRWRRSRRRRLRL